MEVTIKLSAVDILWKLALLVVELFEPERDKGRVAESYRGHVTSNLAD